MYRLIECQQIYSSRCSKTRLDAMKDDGDYEIVDHVEPSNRAWLEWKALVENEGWTSDDLSVLTLTPRLSSTRIVLARKRSDGSFIGTVIWNEYDKVAFIGFYLLLPEYRGRGIGSVIWDRAIARIPKHYTIALRSGPFPTVWRWNSSDSSENLTLLSVTVPVMDDVVKMVDELTKAEYHDLEQFCLSVVKRDRSEFLRQFHDLPFTAATVLFDDDQQIVAYAAVCPTSHSHRHLFKLAPLYASTADKAFAVIRPLIEKVSKLDADARFLFHVLSGTVGSDELLPLFNSLNIPSKTCGVTLFSKEYHNPIDTQRLRRIPRFGGVDRKRQPRLHRTLHRSPRLSRSRHWLSALETASGGNNAWLYNCFESWQKRYPSVENMVEQYKAGDTPVDVPSGSTTKLASDLSIEEYEAVLSYVHEVSGQDRSRLLRLHFALDFIEGAVLMNSASRILAFASVTTTGAEDSHVFKISPVYAEGLDEALSVIRPLLNKIHEQSISKTEKQSNIFQDNNALSLISTWSGSAGEQLRPLLQEKSIHSNTSLYTLYSRPSTNDESWAEWKAAVQAEGWVTSGDDSTLAVTPQLAKAVVARSKSGNRESPSDVFLSGQPHSSDGRYIGSVVWTENDGLAYIGFYILRPEFRGLGIGTAIWNRALARMAPDSHSTTKLVSELSPKEFDAVLSYANEVSGQNRSKLLRLNFELDCTEGAVLIDSTGQIQGFASVVTAGPREDHLYKVAPVYAEGVDEALSAIYPLLDFVHKQDPDAIVILAKWSNSAGEKLQALIKGKATVSSRTAYTLFSRPYKSSMDFTRIGLGIGTAIWQHALERIPCSCTLGLRSVENMVARYKAKDTPVEGQAVAAQRIRVVDLIDIAMAHLLQQSTTKLVSDLSAKEFDAMVGYANEVSGRDRSQLLRLHFDLDCTEGAVLVDSTGRIRAFASAVTTGPQDEHLYKIAPIYADGIGEAFTVIHPLLVKIHTEDPETIALINTWNDSAGEQLRALISDRCTVSKISAYTLFSRSYHNPMDFKRMFAAHNHFGQFDA
ncbi:unnamed protein product [Heligmosomoides polygyrus]|uniref:N-acetyltransferase domain-containing protein n=1 Tax=Heligmosomoides polygyrus TaxID=6339 RepID=A0A183FSZ1_HELPZ|nr:unnamed protein product [Heligmosomoides polygyrus]